MQEMPASGVAEAIPLKMNKMSCSLNKSRMAAWNAACKERSGVGSFCMNTICHLQKLMIKIKLEHDFFNGGSNETKMEMTKLKFLLGSSEDVLFIETT